MTSITTARSFAPVPSLDAAWQDVDRSFELLSQIRTDPALNDLRFLAITADANNQIPTVARAMGADGFLMKPFSNEALDEAIEQAFRTKWFR